MTRFAGVVALLATICLLPAAGAGNSTATALQNAALAWERGDYTSALTTYQELLAGPDADGVLDSIALQTGELYQTTELTTDGSNPGISTDGKYASYETGSGPTRVTRLVSLTSPTARPVADGVTVSRIAELQGFGAVFSLDGSKLAYLKLSPSPALKAAFAELDRAPQAERNVRQAAVNAQSGLEAIITVRDMATGHEEELKTDDTVKSSLVFGSANVVFFAGASASGGSPQQVYTVAEGRAAAPVTAGPGDKTPAFANSTGDAVAITTRMAAGGRGGGGRGGGSYSVLTMSDGKLTPLNTTDRPSFSGDGKTMAFVMRDGDAYRLMVGPASSPGKVSAARTGPERLDAPALSPDGTHVAFQMMPRDDWEIYTSSRDGTGERRLTREIQHDLLPQFLDADRLLGVIGEAAASPVVPLRPARPATRTRLFHNNTVRTIAPEYAWTPSADGTQAPDRRRARRRHRVARARRLPRGSRHARSRARTLRARVAANLAAETRSAAPRRSRIFAPIAARRQSRRRRRVGRSASTATRRRSSTSTRSTSRSRATSSRRHTSSTPTSRSATSRSTSGSSRAARSAARPPTSSRRCKGTVNPELVYVVSSHYDSVAVGPGADDDTSGTAALLETARILAGASAAGDDRLRVVHRRGGRPARQPRVRAARGRRQAAGRRRAQQRHDRLGERPPPRQHDPLLESGHPRHPARRGDAVHAT